MVPEEYICLFVDLFTSSSGFSPHIGLTQVYIKKQVSIMWVEEKGLYKLKQKKPHLITRYSYS